MGSRFKQSFEIALAALATCTPVILFLPIKLFLNISLNTFTMLNLIGLVVALQYPSTRATETEQIPGVFHESLVIVQYVIYLPQKYSSHIDDGMKPI